MLDAARKTRDPALFQRSVDMALQARSGEAALQAAQAWKRDIPSAIEASRYVLQILLALNRVEEAGKALTVSINELPLDEQPGAIASVPRLFGVVQDKALAADVVEKALTQAFTQKATSATAWTTVGRMRRDVGQIDLRIGMKTSAITLGKLDVPAIMVFYVAYLWIWAWLLDAHRQGLGFWLAWLVSVGQVVWHYFLIRHRTREGCFKAFRLNHWLGFSVFVGVVLSYG